MNGPLLKVVIPAKAGIQTPFGGRAGGKPLGFIESVIPTQDHLPLQDAGLSGECAGINHPFDLGVSGGIVTGVPPPDRFLGML